MFRCSKFSDNSFTIIQKLFSKDVVPARRFTVLKCKPCKFQHHHLSKSLYSTSPVNFSGNLGSGLCIIGGSVFFGIGAYKYFTNSNANAAEAQQKDAVILEEQTANTQTEETTPETVTQFPDKVQYLLIGGGTATYSAMRAIRKRDVTAKILIISEEDQVPYMRPPLSKELWFSEDREAARKLRFKQWNGKQRSAFFEEPKYYCEPSELNSKKGGGVALALNTKVVGLNSAENTATLSDGKTVKYDKCLIATGGDPKNLPSVKKAEEEVLKRTTLYRKASDFLKLDEVTDNIQSVTVIGGGFMGSEIACALGHKGKTNGFEVNQIFPESGNMGLVLPEYLTKWTTEKVKKEGVNVLTKAFVKKVCMEGDKVKVVTQNNQEILTDHIVVAVGLDIDTSLAQSAGIEVDENFGGYKVNAELQARSNVWVAGDASCFYDIKLGRRRVEHHDHAVVSGRLAGENMTGAQKPYFHQSMFWSDLGPDVGYEAIGLVDSRLPTVGVFAKATEKDTPKAAAVDGLRSETEENVENALHENRATPESKSEDFGKGVVFYLKNNKVVGLLLWNVFGRMSVARKLIQDQQSHDDYGEVAKLFKIHSEDLD